MEDEYQHPTIVQNVANQLYMRSSLSQGVQSHHGGFQRSVVYLWQFAYGNHINVGLLYPMTCRATKDLSLISANVSPVFVQAPSKKGFAGFAIDFLMGGVSLDYVRTRLANDAKVAKKEDVGGSSMIWSTSIECCLECL